MLKSVYLGISLFLFLTLIILMKFSEERAKKLFNPDEIIVGHIKHYVLLKNKKIKKPMLLSHYTQAIELLEDEALQNKYKSELNIALNNIKDGQNYISLKNITLLFDSHYKKGDYY